MVCQESSTKSQVSAIMSNISLVQLSNLQSVPVNVYSVSHTLILYYSWGEACGWHFIWISHTMCSSQKREQNDPPDPVQSLPQDQRQAGRYQQHPSAKYSVSRTHGHYVLICPFVKKYVKRTLYKRYKSNKKMKNTNVRVNFQRRTLSLWQFLKYLFGRILLFLLYSWTCM